MTDRQPDNERGWDPRVSRGTLLRGTAAAAIGAMAVPSLALGAEWRHHADQGRNAARGVRRRRHRRDAQPVHRRHADRRVAHPEPLRPAGRRQRRPHAQPRSRAVVGAQQGRDGLDGQAAPGRHVPQRQDVRRRGRDLVDPADGGQDELRAAVRLGHPRGRAQGASTSSRCASRSSPRTPICRATSRTTTPGSSPRDRRPRTTRSRSAPGPSRRGTFTPGRQSVFSANKNYWVNGQALRRLAQDHVDRRQHGAPQRAALGPDRRHGAAAHAAGQGARGDGRHPGPGGARRPRR